MIYGRQQTDGGSAERTSLNTIDDGRTNKRCEKRKFIDLNKFNGKVGVTEEEEKCGGENANTKHFGLFRAPLWCSLLPHLLEVSLCGGVVPPKRFYESSFFLGGLLVGQRYGGYLFGNRSLTPTWGGYWNLEEIWLDCSEVQFSQRAKISPKEFSYDNVVQVYQCSI